MRPAEYTQEQIIEAGLDLKAAGRNITGFAIRQKLGGGNPTRLKQIWEEHASTQAVTRSEPVADLPAEVAEELATVAKALTDRLTNLAVELNDKAVKTAERRVADAIHSAGQQRELAERELADATTTVEDLENRLETAENQNASLEQYAAGLKETCQNQAVEAAKLKERLSASEQSLKTAQTQHMAEIRRLLDTAEADFALNNQEAEAQRIKLENLQAMADALHQELATVKAKADAAAETHQEQRKTAAAELNRAAERMAKLEEKVSLAGKEARAAREEAATLRGKLQAYETMLGKQAATKPAVVKP
jgi:chromosome segregation ATPase